MKIKSTPQDFIVEEITDLEVKDYGLHAVYRLHKTGTNTLDVITDIAKRFHIPRRDIGYGGLKDRHASTVQIITMPKGKPARIFSKNYTADLIGYSENPMTKSALLGNRFKVRVIEIHPQEREYIENNLHSIETQGYVNYYDEQRFSSAKHGKGFVAQKIIAKKYSEAVRLLFECSSQDNSRDRKFRKCVLENWKDWEKCVGLAPTAWERDVIKHLMQNPNGWRHGLEKVDREFMFLLGTVYQAYLWNRIASRFIAREISQESLKPLLFSQGQLLNCLEKLGDDDFHRLIYEKIPLLSPKIEILSDIDSIIAEVLTEEGIDDLRMFRSQIPGLVFKTNQRNIIELPRNFQWRWTVSMDSMWELLITVELSKGAYLTMLLKQATMHRA